MQSCQRACFGGGNLVKLLASAWSFHKAENGRRPLLSLCLRQVGLSACSTDQPASQPANRLLVSVGWIGGKVCWTSCLLAPARRPLVWRRRLCAPLELCVCKWAGDSTLDCCGGRRPRLAGFLSFDQLVSLWLLCSRQWRLYSSIVCGWRSRRHNCTTVLN